jgi:Putative adhesin
VRVTTGRITAVAIGVPIALASAGWGAFTMVGLLSQGSEHHEATYPWHGGVVDLTVSSGSVQVEIGTGTQVRVSYTEHFQLKRPTVSSSVSANGVQLSAKCAGGVFGNNCDINYVLTVPATATLTLNTGDGDVTGARLSSRQVEATTGDGDVRLGWSVAPSRVVASSGDGDINLTVPTGSGPYRTSTNTGDGGVHVTVPTDPAATATITAQTGDGGIVIALAPAN